jgi:hypothetical protein
MSPDISIVPVNNNYTSTQALTFTPTVEMYSGESQLTVSSVQIYTGSGNTVANSANFLTTGNNDITVAITNNTTITITVDSGVTFTNGAAHILRFKVTSSTGLSRDVRFTLMPVYVEPGTNTITYQYLDGKVMRITNWNSDTDLNFYAGDTVVNGVKWLDVVTYTPSGAGSTTYYYKCKVDVSYNNATAKHATNPESDSQH